MSVYVLDIPLKLWEMDRSAALEDDNLFSWNMISDKNNTAASSSPTWSPDSRKVAFLSMSRPGYESDHMHIELWDAAKGGLTSLSSAVDLSFGSLTWDSLPQQTFKPVTEKAAGGSAVARSGKEYGSIAAAAASAVQESDLLEPEEAAPDSYEYTIYATAQYRASGRVFKLDVHEDSSSGALLKGVSVMSGDEGRAAPMLASAVNAFTKKPEKVLYYMESTLTSPNVLKAAALSKQMGPTPLFQPFTYNTVPAGLHAVQCSDQNPHMKDIFCPNPQYLNGDLSLSTPVQYYFASKDAEGNSMTEEKDLVHCWYLPPAFLQKGGEDTAGAASVPLILIIHGGPQGAITNAWNYRWNLSYYASLGYGVVAVNFHGSSGFGVQYLDSIRGEWGGQPYRDCMACTDFILKEKSYLNADKVGAMGASYGGYMINWINGHDPEGKFKCLVNHDGIFGLRNLYYTTEEVWFPEWEFGIPHVTNPSDKKTQDSRFDPQDSAANTSGASQYEKYDPCLFVDQWRTPTLVIQGCKDHRVVETEGIATFTALQRKGIHSKFLVFPDENHWCLKAVNSLHWYGTVTDWLASFLL